MRKAIVTSKYQACLRTNTPFHSHVLDPNPIHPAYPIPARHNHNHGPLNITKHLQVISGPWIIILASRHHKKPSLIRKHGIHYAACSWRLLGQDQPRINPKPRIFSFLWHSITSTPYFSYTGESRFSIFMESQFNIRNSVRSIEKLIVVHCIS